MAVLLRNLQVRWSTVLYRMMARMKSKVSVTVPWRPLYQCVRHAYMRPLNTFTGALPTPPLLPCLLLACCACMLHCMYLFMKLKASSTSRDMQAAIHRWLGITAHAFSCAGPSIQENHKEVILKLIRTLRRFFAPEAAQEIWAFFKPKLLTVHPDFQEACHCSLRCV